MKLMFASDLHGSLSATDKILELFAQSQADWLILLGDLLNHGPRNALPDNYQPAQVAERLNHVSDKIVAVRGNCDSEVESDAALLPDDGPLPTGAISQKTIVFNPRAPLSSQHITAFNGRRRAGVWAYAFAPGTKARGYLLF